MPQVYGFAGAHRTGKTTLARDVAQKLGVPFCETSLSARLRELGINPQADYPLHMRLMIQNALLDTLIDNYQASIKTHPGCEFIVADRTPIDILAYSMSEVLRGTMTPQLDRQFYAHEWRCLEFANAAMMGICVVPPGIPLIADPSKATANAYYQRHIHYCMQGVAFDKRLSVEFLLLHPNNVELPQRERDAVEHCLSILQQRETTRSTIVSTYH